MTVDWTKPIRWTLGEVRLLATDLGGSYPVAVALREPRWSLWVVTECNANGLLCRYGGHIENITEPRLMWINVYPDGDSRAGYQTRKAADIGASHDRSHVLRINLDTGECVKEDP